MKRIFVNIKTRVSLWDKKISHYISEKIATNSKKFERFYAKSGNTLPWLIFSIICFVFNLFIPRIELLIQWLAMGTTFLVVMLLKFSIRRKRPVDEIPSELVGKGDLYSFPSGHAGRMGCLAVIMVMFFPKIGWIFFIWTLIVGFGRIATQVHYFFDILGGTFIGGTVGSLFFLIRSRLINFFEPFVNWLSSFLF
ncbi:MAG: phosphatase PAP2 family protein [Candidatus Heimdallarchaeaceae archaeon]